MIIFNVTGLTQNHDKTNRKGRKGHKGIRVSESSCVSPGYKRRGQYTLPKVIRNRGSAIR